jgi:hypothetical protein
VLSVPRANETSRSMLLGNVDAPNPVPFWYTYGVEWVSVENFRFSDVRVYPLADPDGADLAEPATELVAKRIIELAQQGERDRDRLRKYGVNGI